MAGGPYPAFSAIPVTSARTFPNIVTGNGEKGMGVEASVGADSIWRLRFQLPGTLPTGTCKLLLVTRAAAATGNAKVNPKWASVAALESPDAASLQAEGTTTIAWTTGYDASNGVYVVTKITLDADTPVAGEIIAMDLTFETASWTLAARSTWQAFVIFE